MIPDNTLSNPVFYAPFMQGRVAQHSVPLVDYELGGIALNNVDEGLFYQLWTLRKVGNDLIVFDEAGNGTPIIAAPTAKRVSLAFDQNMRPLIAYSTPSASYLYWFDPLVNDAVTTEIPGASFLRLTLDDHRPFFTADSDVILAYHVGNSLRYRQQRERFAIERTLLADTGDARLTAIGMNTGYRLQFKFRGELPPLPPPPPPPSYRYWRVNITAANTHPSVAEVEMAATTGGANIATGGTPIASGSYPGAQHVPANAFNGVLDASDCWASDNASAGWIGYDFGTPVIVKEVRICARNSYGQSPRDFTIEHSNDGVSWTPVASYTNVTSWPAYTLVPFAVP